MTTRRNRNLSDDSDITICVEDDVQPKNRKKGKKAKKKKDVKKEYNEDDFGGINVEGLPDNEKEQIRQAILASRQDSNTRYEDSSQSDVPDKDEIESVPDENDTSNQISDDDVLNDKTLEEEEDLEVYLAATQNDSLISRSNTSSQHNKQEGVLQSKTQDDVTTEDYEEVLDLTKSTLNDDDFETQKPESPVEPTLDYEVEENLENCDENLNKVKSSSQSSCQSQGPRIKSASVKQHESQGSSRSITTERSQQGQGSNDFQYQRSSQRSTSSDSQGSGGFVPTVKESDSQNSQKSLSYDGSLVRHYRAVKCQIHCGPPYFCPDSEDPKQYFKLIIRMIDDYNMKLKQAQKMFKNKIPWPETVKPGQHHEKTIDVKRRGHNVKVFDIDDDDDFKTVSTSKMKQEQVPLELNSDDGLPDLIVEKDTDRHNFDKSSTPVRDENRNNLNNVIYSAAEAAAIITKTVGEEDDVANIDNSESIKKAPVSLGQGAESKKKRKQGIRKRAQKVLAPETQIDDYTDDYFETLKKPKVDAVVAETQFIDENDWLSSDKIPLGNQNQRQDLRGYKIPRINKEQNDKSNSNSKSKGQTIVKTQTDKKRKTRPKVLVEETQDIDFEELLNSDKTRSQKVRRACFKIDNISSDDDESVAETQPHNSPIREDMNGKDETELEEPCENETENESQGFFAKMKTKAFNTVKKMFSPAEEPIQENRENEPESPIIQRSRTRKLFNANSSKFDQTLTSERDSEVNSGIFKNQQEESENKTKVFGRNASKDSILSNNSDNVSIASSQVSNTLLDDNGDLYSTQFPEKINGNKSTRKRKAINQHSECDSVSNKGAMKTNNVQTTENSDDDIMVIDINTNDYSQPQVSKTGKRQNSANKRQKVTRNKQIDQCFTKEKIAQNNSVINQKNIGDEYDFVVEEDEDTTINEHRNENELVDENPFPKTYSKASLKGAHKIVNNFDNETSQSKSVLGDMLNRPPVIKIGRSTTKQFMDPVDIRNFAGTSHSSEARNHSTRGQKGRVESQHRKEVFNLDPDGVEISDDESNSGQKEFSNQRTKDVNMIDCPLCGKQFSDDVIQAHAENCQGQDEEEAHPQQEDVPYNGETDACCLCDKQIPKHLLERHTEECFQNMAEQQQQEQQAAKEEPVQTRRTKHRINPETGSQVNPGRSPRLHRDSPLRYIPEDSEGSVSESGDGSSWDESDTSGSDENITLKSIALSGTAALVDGPWNKDRKKVTQSNGNDSDWLKDISNSPIKSFVPISKQEDSEYYQKQFSYNKKKVEQRQAKRKRTQGKQKRRRKRRRVTKKKKTT